MPFTADLNPKSGNSMSLADLVKMNEYIGAKSKVPAEPKKPAPIIDKSTPFTPPNLKSSADDAGVPFKFGNNYQSE